MSQVQVKIKKLDPTAVVPFYSTEGAAGLDLVSIEDIEVPAGTTVAIRTGLAVAIPKGYGFFVLPRSGLALKARITVGNSPGLVDSDYRGEVKVLLHNEGVYTHKVSKGDKIAQTLVLETPVINFIEVAELDETTRGEGGFGSTGMS